MRILAAIGVLGILVVIAAAVFFFGGFYSVAANNPEPEAVRWALIYVRTASIERHADETPPASLDDPATVQAGARVFARLGCANCHGAPGVDWAKFSEGMRPDPPDLKEIAPALTAEQIFWVLEHGINMTGMPSFGAIKTPDNDLWAVAAFVKRLPLITPEDYKAWTAEK